MRTLARFGRMVLATFALVGAAAHAAGTGPAAPEQQVLTAEQIAYVLSATKSVSGGYSKIDLPSVTFEYNSAELTPEARTQLDQVAKALGFAAFRDKAIRIAGHTDSSGSAAYNETLSAKRAASVLAYLKDQHQFDPARMKAEGLGASAPIKDLPPDAPGQRRVEFSLR